MELKPQNDHRANQRNLALNRTILELKQPPSQVPCKLLFALNRTILELKQRNGSNNKTHRIALNRTILELKHLSKIQASRSLIFFKSYHFGIETLFAGACQSKQMLL